VWAGQPAEEDEGEVLYNGIRLPAEWPPRLKQRICWLARTRFENDAVLEEAKEYLRHAKAAGYTAVVLGNSKWLAWPAAWGEDYQKRLRDIGNEARKLGLELIPYVTNFGSGGSLLSHDPHLAEGIPVRDALFVVRGREATVRSDPPIQVDNPGFEQVDGNRFRDWTVEMGKQDVSVFVDSTVFHGGTRSLRMESFRTAEEKGRCRLVQWIDLTPARLYRMSVWIKSEELDPAGQANVSFWTGKRHLCYTPLDVKPTQDWTRH